MADFDDLPLDRDGSAPAVAPAPRPPAGPSVWPLLAVAALIAGLVALWYFGGRRTTPPPAATPAGAAQTTVDLPRRQAEPGEAINLPPLDQTDAIVRTLVARLSAHPAVAAWLTTDGLIRNFTVVLTNVADGETPAQHLQPLRPKGTFATRQSGGLTWIDPASYARYDGAAAAVEGLDARGAARLYATLRPRIDNAYRDLLGGDTNFDRTLERAIVMLLRTPIADDQVQLLTGKMSYAFADPGLEALTEAQRQFLRMGPRNMRIVKTKLREVAGYLGIPDSALPPPGGR